jgi:hypothetical protein
VLGSVGVDGACATRTEFGRRVLARLVLWKPPCDQFPRLQHLRVFAGMPALAPFVPAVSTKRAMAHSAQLGILRWDPPFAPAAERSWHTPTCSCTRCAARSSVSRPFVVLGGGQRPPAPLSGSAAEVEDVVGCGRRLRVSASCSSARSGGPLVALEFREFAFLRELLRPVRLAALPGRAPARKAKRAAAFEARLGILEGDQLMAASTRDPRHDAKVVERYGTVEGQAHASFSDARSLPGSARLD